MEKFNELADGRNSAMNAGVISVNEKLTKSGKPYSEITLADGASQIVAKMWQDPKQLQFAAGDVVSAEIEVQQYNGSQSFILNAAAKVVGADFRSLLPHAPIDAEGYWNEMVSVLDTEISNKVLHDMTLSLLNKSKDAFMVHPAAKGIHHAFINGLLYHTGRMVKSAMALSGIYDVNKSILLSATALHDYGKLVEMQMDNNGATTYTPYGVMFGHAVIAIEAIDDYCRENNVDGNDENIIVVKHCIAAHHGQLDWGALAVPCVKEAQLLHFIDNIDAKMETYEENIDAVEPGTLGEKVFSLNSPIYNPNL